ncbi:MAG: hypothetical protein JWQ66_1683 [Mucilaginibacter sp.]|nr:hypothetical protein [Mucilaginibacter sp.]
MDPYIFRILDFLAVEGVNRRTNISIKLNEIHSEGKRLLDPNDTKLFLNALRPYTNIDASTVYPSRSLYGFSTFEIHITDDGIKAYKAERDRIRQREVDESVIATNNAVQNMNQRMLENAKSQAEIMLQQAGFTGEQVELAKRQVTLIGNQNKLYRITLFLTGLNILLSIVIIIMTHNANGDKELISNQSSRLQEQQKEIKQLQLLKADTVHYVLHYPVLKSKSKVK